MVSIQPVEYEAEATPAQADGPTSPSPQESALLRDHESMLKEIRSWGLWSLGFGALHLATGGFLSAPWGVLLLLVGLASFYFKSAGMFVIYAVTLAWAAFSNLAGGQAGWVFFALVQFFLAYRVFKQYARFRAVEGEIRRTREAGAPDRAAQFFPWLGSLLGCASLLGLFLFFAVVIVLTALAGEADAPPPAWLDFAAGLVLNLGVLGFALALAARLSGYRPRALTIVGLVAGSLILLVQLALYLL